MEVKTTFYVERGEDEIELFIMGDAEPGYPARLSGHPDNWEPGEGDSCCVEAIFLDEDCTQRWDGKLTQEEESEAESMLLDALKDKLEGEVEAAAEAKAEAMMEDRYFGGMGRYGRYGPDIYDF